MTVAQEVNKETEGHMEVMVIQVAETRVVIEGEVFEVEMVDWAARQGVPV